MQRPKTKTKSKGGKNQKTSSLTVSGADPFIGQLVEFCSWHNLHHHGFSLLMAMLAALL
jgi:hypothetical protein